MIRVTSEEVFEGVNGACRSCGEIIYGGVEPDARNYECPECGEQEVFGLEELLLTGEIALEE